MKEQEEQEQEDEVLSRFIKGDYYRILLEEPLFGEVEDGEEDICCEVELEVKSFIRSRMMDLMGQGKASSATNQFTAHEAGAIRRLLASVKGNGGVPRVTKVLAGELDKGEISILKKIIPALATLPSVKSIQREQKKEAPAPQAKKKVTVAKTPVRKRIRRKGSKKTTQAKSPNSPNKKIVIPESSGVKVPVKDGDIVKEGNKTFEIKELGGGKFIKKDVTPQIKGAQSVPMPTGINMQAVTQQYASESVDKSSKALSKALASKK